MSSRSIVDRVLLFAAAVCTAGLVWQLTVLMTAKGSTPAPRKIDVVATTQSPRTESAPAAPSTSTVRVVYPDGGAAKMTGKAVDTPEGAPVALASQSAMNAASAPPTPPAAAAKDIPAAVVPNSPPVGASPTPAAVASSPAVIESVSAQGAVAAPAAAPPPATVVSSAPAPLPVAEPSPASASPDAADASNEVASTVAAPPSGSTAPPRPRKVASLAPADPAVRSAPTDKTPPKHGGLNINRASIEALNHLPGAGRIGQAIADHRPYRSVEDLLAKRVVRRSVYEQIKHQLAAE